MIPIVIEHDYNRSIGYFYFEDGKLMAKFNKPITKSQFFEIFPNAGIRCSVLDPEPGFKDWYIEDIEIIEFSYMPD